MFSLYYITHTEYIECIHYYYTHIVYIPLCLFLYTLLCSTITFVLPEYQILLLDI